MDQKLSPVLSAGRYECEHEDCKVVQTGEEMEHVLFYGSDDGMYCREHIDEHLHGEEVNDNDREEIARLIEQGNTSGILDDENYRISWSLDINKFKN